MRTRKYDPEHAKYKSTVRGGIMARYSYIRKFPFPNFVTVINPRMNSICTETNYVIGVFWFII